jgi:transcriptional regulator with XRE-family HTH domain
MLQEQNLGRKIRKLRELKQINQEQMAEFLNLSTAGYGKLERGEVKIDTERLEKIAKTLEVEVSDIYHFDEKAIFNIIQNNKGKSKNGYIVNHQSGKETELYERVIAEKDQTITALKNEITALKSEVETLRKMVLLLESK